MKVTKRDKYTLSAGFLFVAVLINLESSHIIFGIICGIVCMVCTQKAIK